MDQTLRDMSKEQLLDLIQIYSKNWLALDGLWFQSVERKYGLDEAMFHDMEAWKRYTVIEARRIKQFLGLPEHPGLPGLAKAMGIRFNGVVNEHEIVLEPDRMYYRTVTCRVQSARRRKGMPLHPCKAVGSIEYSEFARTIDDRIRCRCISCYPDAPADATGCSWEFTIAPEAAE